jgi:hypothetical protein
MQIASKAIAKATRCKNLAAISYPHREAQHASVITFDDFAPDKPGDSDAKSALW